MAWTTDENGPYPLAPLRVAKGRYGLCLGAHRQTEGDRRERDCRCKGEPGFFHRNVLSKNVPQGDNPEMDKVRAQKPRGSPPRPVRNDYFVTRNCGVLRVPNGVTTETVPLVAPMELSL